VERHLGNSKALRHVSHTSTQNIYRSHAFPVNVDIGEVRSLTFHDPDPRILELFCAV
jgi:hypothetical protein